MLLKNTYCIAAWSGGIKKYEEGIYVTSDGRVLTSKPKQNQFGIFGWLRKWKHLNIGSNGYLNCSYRTGNRSNKVLTVHRVVAELFVERPDGTTEVNHINGIKTDNRSENLEWCTKSYNNIHAYDTGLKEVTPAMMKVFKSKKMSLRKLTDSQVSVIRSSNLSQLILAEKFNVSQSTISNICKGEIYA